MFTTLSQYLRVKKGISLSFMKTSSRTITSCVREGGRRKELSRSRFHWVRQQSSDEGNDHVARSSPLCCAFNQQNLVFNIFLLSINNLPKCITFIYIFIQPIQEMKNKKKKKFYDITAFIFSDFDLNLFCCLYFLGIKIRTWWTY